MKYKIFLVLALFQLFSSGCEKDLDIKPTNILPEEVALSTVDGLDGGLNYAYNAISLYVGRNYTYWSDLFSDHLVYRGTIQNNINFYNRDQNAIISELAADGIRNLQSNNLRTLNVGVNAASLVVRAAEKELAATDIRFAGNKDRLVGEGKFIRALINFEMVRLYAKAWGATPNNSHAGIIINEEPVDSRESQIKARATLAETYDFIIRDLTDAEAKLPETFDAAIHTNSAYARATTKDAARAILARVYFQQREYVKAKEAINRAIGASAGSPAKHALEPDVSQTFLDISAAGISPENIFSIVGSQVPAFNPNGFWYANAGSAIGGPYAGTTPTGVASNAFLNDARFSATDNRRILLLRTLSDGKISPIKYQVAYQNIPVIRSAELLLDRAEIDVLSNNLADAIKDCNLVRTRALLDPLPANINQAQLTDSIRVERIRELCFEGDRLHNLKRMQVPIPAGDRAGKPALPWDGNELILKYDANEIFKNPLLENN